MFGRVEAGLPTVEARKLSVLTANRIQGFTSETVRFKDYMIPPISSSKILQIQDMTFGAGLAASVTRKLSVMTANRLRISIPSFLSGFRSTPETAQCPDYIPPFYQREREDQKNYKTLKICVRLSYRNFR